MSDASVGPHLDPFQLVAPWQPLASRHFARDSLEFLGVFLLQCYLLYPLYPVFMYIYLYISPFHIRAVLVSHDIGQSWAVLPNWSEKNVVWCFVTWVIWVIRPCWQSNKSWGRRSGSLTWYISERTQPKTEMNWWINSKLIDSNNRSDDLNTKLLLLLSILIRKIPVFAYPFQQVSGVGFFILRAAKNSNPPVSQYPANLHVRKWFQAALRTSHTCPKFPQNSWPTSHLLSSACFTLLWSTGRNTSFEPNPGSRMAPGPVSLRYSALLWMASCLRHLLILAAWNTQRFRSVEV